MHTLETLPFDNAFARLPDAFYTRLPPEPLPEPYLVAASPAADIEKNARALMSGFFAKLDLVTREEFDIQAQVLLRTREKLKALEERVARLENPPSGD